MLRHQCCGEEGFECEGMVAAMVKDKVDELSALKAVGVKTSDRFVAIDVGRLRVYCPGHFRQAY